MQLTDVGVLFASWCNLFLWTVELGATSYYFKNWIPSRVRKLIVTLVFGADALSTAVSCLIAFKYLLDSSTTVVIGSFNVWSIAVTTFLTLISSVTEEFFLIYRCWCLTKNRILVGVLCALVAVHALFLIASGTLFSISSIDAISQRVALLVHMLTVIFNAAADVGLTGVMLCLIPKMKDVFEFTRGRYKRVILSALVSGVGSALISLLSLILLFTTDNGFIILSASLGRCYTLTLLLNFITDPKPDDLRSQRLKHGSNRRNPGARINESVQLNSLLFRRNTSEQLSPCSDGQRESGDNSIKMHKADGKSESVHEHGELMLTRFQSRKAAATLGVHFVDQI